jgi:RimJ/RimL family protein N-acetyltransferase
LTLPGGAPPRVRRLLPADAAAYHELRLEGFARHPLQFRIAPEDEAGRSLEAVAQRLATEYVVGGPVGGPLLGIGGLSRFVGAKLEHKGLLWGMYVREEARGTGLAGAIVEALLDRAADKGLESVVLTVAADNLPARRLYERSGFVVYGVEPRAAKVADAYFDEALMVCPIRPAGKAPSGVREVFSD